MYLYPVYFTAIRYILWTFYAFVVIWYIFPRFGMLHQEKSGNPGVATLLTFQATDLITGCLSLDAEKRKKNKRKKSSINLVLPLLIRNVLADFCALPKQGCQIVCFQTKNPHFG
jgi:hypothetical protein